MPCTSPAWTIPSSPRIWTAPDNTYKYGGLPAGPICNPSLSSIKAAVHPNDTGYYYFAYGKDGVSHFFRTYDEHLAFVNSDMYAPD